MIASGTRIRQYEVISPLGAGGMGEVYLATDHTLGRRVALKFLPADAAEDEQAARRLLQEARAAASLDHPNICAIYETGEDGPLRYIVMPLVEGETLAARLRRGPLHPVEAVSIAAQVASALAAAHDAGIVHRDIKPQNIMLMTGGRVMVLDFGIAAVAGAARPPDAETATKLTVPGTVLGTWPYMSPEQVRGAQVDGRSDIFSLGVVLFECVWGVRPFEAPSPAEVVSKILTHDPLPEGGPDVVLAPALVPIVRRCLEKDRARRYARAADLLADLERVRQEITAPASAAPRPKRRRGLLVAAIAVVAAALAGGAWWMTRARPPAPLAAETPTGRAAAYDDYVRGKVKLRVRTREETADAIALLRRSVAADPAFAPAQAELARAEIFMAFQFATVDEQKALLEDAEVSIEKAFAADPNLAEAHLARGLLVWTRARNFPHDLAIRAYRRAIALDPNLDEAHHELAVVYMHVGLLDEAKDELQKTLTINPDNMLARARLGTTAVYQGDYAKAITILEGVPEEASPTYRSRALADALVRAGRIDDAEALVDAYLARYPNDDGGAMTSVRAIIRARQGDRAGAQEAVKQAIAIGSNAWHFHHTAYNIACTNAILGEPAEAVRWLRDAAKDGFPCYPYYANDKLLDALRSDPAFQSFLGEVKSQWEELRQLR